MAGSPRAPIALVGQLLLPAGPRAVRIAPGRVLIRGSRIEAVAQGEKEFDFPYDLGGPEHLICPGFTDTHLHIPQFDSIGITGLELLDWLDRVIFPSETRWADADYAGEMADRVARTLLSCGTTAVAAYATSHGPATQNAIDAFGRNGLAGTIGLVLMDQQGPPELLRPFTEAIPGVRRLVPNGRILPGMAPRFAVSCSSPMLAAAGECAAQLKCSIQTHLAETRAECDLACSLHNAPDYTSIYERAALLTERTLLGHGIHLSSDELSRIQRSKSIIAHCPTANRFLRAGTMNRAATIAQGVSVSLGSDVAGGPDRCMVRVARAMIEAAESLAKGEPFEIPSVAEAWWQITAGNAAAIGLTSAGSLAPGRDADVLVVQPSPGWLTTPSPLGTAMYGWDDRWLETVFASGSPVWSRSAT